MQVVVVLHKVEVMAQVDQVVVVMLALLVQTEAQILVGVLVVQITGLSYLPKLWTTL